MLTTGRPLEDGYAAMLASWQMRRSGNAGLWTVADTEGGFDELIERYVLAVAPEGAPPWAVPSKAGDQPRAAHEHREEAAWAEVSSECEPTGPCPANTLICGRKLASLPTVRTEPRHRRR